MIQYENIPAEHYKEFFGTFLPKFDTIAIDVETSGLYWYKDYLKTIAFSIGKDQNYTVAPFGTEEEACLKTTLKEFYDKYKGTQVYHNSKFDMHMIRDFMGVGIDFFYDAKVSDTMVMACLLDENRYVGLKSLAKTLLHVQPVAMEDDLLYYNAQDAENTYRLWEMWKSDITTNFESLYRQEMELVKCLTDMEQAGVYIDVPYFTNLRSTIQKQLIEYQQQFIQVFGRKINPSSTEQLAQALRELGFEGDIEETTAGNDSVPKALLVRLAEEDKTIGALLDYKRLTKLLTTYVDNYLEMNVDGVLYPNFNMSTSEFKKIREDGRPIATGRLSSSNPNLQNVPVKDFDIIRKGFICREHPMYYFDYSNIEYRIVAHYSQEPKLIQAYLEGGDMHQATADALGVDRATGKTMNFAIIYGAGVKKIAKSLGIDEVEAYSILRKFNEAFPSLKATQNKVENVLRERGYVRNLYGRYRRLSGSETYKGFNSLIQGSAADMMKSVMIKIWESLKVRGSRIMLPIHDELVVEVPNDESDVPALVKGIMEQEADFLQLAVPIPVDVAKTTTNWAEEKEINLDETND